MAIIWVASVVVTAFGAWVLFDAEPGINWFLWTGIAAAGLVVMQRKGGSWGIPSLVVGAVAAVIAGGAAVTANPLMHLLVCASVVVYLSVQLSLTLRPSWNQMSLPFVILSPFLALKAAVFQSIARAVELTDLIKSTRAKAAVRGIAITLPVLLVFSLLLSGADPLFASWRESLRELISEEFLSRIAFFGLLLVLVLGSYGLAARKSVREEKTTPNPPTRWLGSTERLILLAGVALLVWLFLAVQLSYLFGNLPGVAGSGVTFAEYARRGFGELTIVATASGLLILLTKRYGRHDDRQLTLRLLTLAVILAVVCLLGSAFRRVWLYEQAYGFTTARLYAQVYMAAVAVGLVSLCLETFGELDTGRLFRRFLAPATILFVGLVYWNHEGWIASRNIDRYAETGELDIDYLSNGLSPGALPAIAARMGALPEPVKSQLQAAIGARYGQHPIERQDDWFEWNLSRSRARATLLTSFENAGRE